MAVVIGFAATASLSDSPFLPYSDIVGGVAIFLGGVYIWSGSS
jgi:hypothetical protein